MERIDDYKPTETGTGSPRKSIEERLADLEACCKDLNYIKFRILIDLTNGFSESEEKVYKFKNLKFLLENLDYISLNFNFDDGGILNSKFMDIFIYMVEANCQFDYELCSKFIDFLLKHNCFGGGIGNIKNLEVVFKNRKKGLSYDMIGKIINEKSLKKDGKQKRKSKKRKSKKRSKRKM